MCYKCCRRINSQQIWLQIFCYLLLLEPFSVRAVFHNKMYPMYDKLLEPAMKINQLQRNCLIQYSATARIIDVVRDLDAGKQGCSAF